jgi:ankyrin repeat protein
MTQNNYFGYSSTTVVSSTQASIFTDAINGSTNKIKIYINKYNYFDINSSAEYDTFKLTLLHIATETNNEELVRFLLSKGADFNQKNRYDKTPWDIAILHGNQKIIDLYLLKKEEGKNKELEKLKGDNVFYNTRFQTQRKRVQTLESINTELTDANKNLSVRLRKETDNFKREKRKCTVLENSLSVERKSKKGLEIENSELSTKNKKLKTAVENLSNSLRK